MIIKTGEGAINQCAIIMRMVNETKTQEIAHEKNAKCKPANWRSLASYITYAFSVPCSEDEAKEAVKKFC